MSGIVLDTKTLGALTALRDRLRDDPAYGMGYLPAEMPDGSDIKTLAQITALTGWDDETAALAVAQNGSALPELLAEAKELFIGMAPNNPLSVGVGTVLDRAKRIESRRKRRRVGRSLAHEPRRKALSGDTATYDDSVCVMLQPDYPNAVKWPGGNPPDKLHVTLAWYGKVDDVDGTEAGFLQSLRNIAQNYNPILASLNGLTRFSNETASGKDPVVVNVDSPAIDQLRQDVLHGCGPSPSEHGFTPHMTLAYIDPEDDMPVQRFNAQAMYFDSLLLSWGGNDHVIPFPEAKKDSDVPE